MPFTPAVLSLLAAYVFSIFFRSFLSVVATDLSRDLGIGPAELGLLGGAWFVVFALAQFPVGYALDAVGPRRTTAGCMAVGVAGTVLFATATGYPQALIGMGLIGLGCAPVFMAPLTIFARTLPTARFGAASSIFVALGSAGNLLAASPLSSAVTSFGWRGTLLAIAAAFAVATVAVAALVRDPPRAVGAERGLGFLDGLRATASIRPLWLILPIVFVSYAVLVTERGLWVAPYLRDVHLLDATAAGRGALVMAVAMTLGALAFAPIERMIGSQKGTVLASLGAFVPAIAMLAAFGHQSVWGAIALFALLGASGFSYGVLMAHARLFFPPNLIGRGMTFVNFAFIAGSAAVQALSGLALRAAGEGGYAPADAYALMRWGFVAALLLAGFVYLAAPMRPPAPAASAARA